MLSNGSGTLTKLISRAHLHLLLTSILCLHISRLKLWTNFKLMRKLGFVFGSVPNYKNCKLNLPSPIDILYIQLARALEFNNPLRMVSLSSNTLSNFSLEFQTYHSLTFLNVLSDPKVATWKELYKKCFLGTR